MYFTQEDYIKIENWLQANSVKDTEFPEASNLSLNEQLTIIQRGENKRIKLEDLVNFLFSQSDSELDVQSTKPIQNQAVARAIYELQNRKFIEIVEELPPISNAKDSVVYILLDEVGEDNNLFTEWIKVNNTWEKVGEFKAEIDLSPYLKIQDSPFEKGNAEHSAVLKGGNNQATNANEVAFGKYNKSNNGTQFSIGIGTSDTDRKNAVEVKQNGDIYVEGVEGRIQDKLNATNMLDKQLTELSNKVDNLPQKEGNYPLLHVGTADDLAGRGESVPASFGFRASGGKSIKDGRAYIKRIKGNSVVWNQKLGDASWNIQFNNSEIAKSKEGATYIISYNDFEPTEGDKIDHGFILLNRISFHAHKYLFIADAQGQYIEAVKCGIYDGSQYLFLGQGAVNNNRCVYFHTFSSAFISRIVRFDVNVNSSNYAKANTIRLTPRIYDLTQMFGAGNEPTTIEEFNARVATLGIDMYAYNEGEVIHCNTESIKSVGDNAWDEEWELGTFNTTTGEDIVRTDQIRSRNLIKVLPNEQYHYGGNGEMWVIFYDANKNVIASPSGASSGNSIYKAAGERFTTPSNAAFMKFYLLSNYGTTYNHDILISLYHSGWKAQKDDQYQPYWQDILPLPIIRKYFPDGMKSAGNACDVIDCKKKQAITKVGVASNLSFSQMQEGVFYVDLPNMKLPTSTMERMKGIFTNRYAVETDSPSVGNMADKSIIRFADGNIYIKDMSYTNADEFNTANADLIVCYELAEPIVTELDAEDQNFRDYYNVADFGTEQSQSSVPSAAFSADIIYQFNAVDMIREHELEITELQSIIATMQAQLASLINN